MISTEVLTVVLGGGKGSRLYPLTQNRAKPAVPFGAKYRLVDIPISNSINAGFKSIYVLTQFNSASLHLHIANTYRFDGFTKGFVEVLAAEQTFDHSGWYEGTGDAVRKNFVHLRTQEPAHYMILSGDQLYRMDLADFFKQHVESGCDVSVAATTVTRDQASTLGILTADPKSQITEFTEKPGPDADISHMKVPAGLHPNPDHLKAGREYLASMGIYCFRAAALEQALDNNFTDFGKEIIPKLMSDSPVHAYIYSGYWEDIGTIRSFYDANLNLSSVDPDFNFYLEKSPIFTHKRDLPASKINYALMERTLAADGCIITNARIKNSLIGIRTIIESDTELDGVFCMGADSYETPERRSENRERGIPDLGIGNSTKIRGAIIDKGARIGAGCQIGIEDKQRDDIDTDSYFIRDGIIIIPKNGVIQPGTVI